MTELETLRAENERLKTIIRHAVADRTGVYFICGEGGERDSVGLPDLILVCPAPGADGMSAYKKITEYSAPGY